MKWLTKLERKHIPNFRKNKGYLIAKLIIVAPIAVPLYYIRLGLKYLISLVVIKRKYKPDIKLQNILVGGDGKHYLADFGFVIKDGEIHTAFGFTQCYISPL